MSKCVPPQIIESLKTRVRNGEITADDIAKLLPEERVALRAILEDVVAENLGIKVSTEELQEISTRSKRIDQAYKAALGKLGNPAYEQENVDFFNAKKEMDDYLASKNPANRLKVLTGTIGRGAMLASVKSPVLNIGSNIEVGFTEALSRRLASGQLKSTDNQLALDYIKLANKIYQQSGYDISRMMSMDDPGTSGERVLGEKVGAQGPGRTRKAGRIVEDIVFKQLMGAPDVAFASAHFADSVSLNAMKLARGDKEQARKYMLDAMLVEPQTEEGQVLKSQGVLDAQKATWTDDSWASKVSSDVRSILNNQTGDARLGDFVFPFIKTPSNVIATGMDYAGMGIPKALVKTYKAWKTGDLGNKAYQQAAARDIVRSGLGFVGAMMIAGLLDDDDFVGAYDPARAQIESLRNSRENAIRIGGKWISTDWLGPLAIPVTAIMYARKYGDTPGEMAFQYSSGVASAWKNLPGVEGVLDYARSDAYKKTQTFKESVMGVVEYAVTEASARLIPSFLSDLARAQDNVERKTSGPISAVGAKIPFIRKALPAKKDIFGEPIKTEPGLSVILFGTRVKTDRENGVIKEISDVSRSVGKGITFTNWEKSSSKQLAQFKEKVGEAKYQEATEKYGQELKRLLYKELAGKYWKKTDEDKYKALTGLDTEAMTKVFKQYGYKYKKQ